MLTLPTGLHHVKLQHTNIKTSEHCSWATNSTKQPSYMLQDRQITEEVRHTFEDIISKKSFPTKGKFYPGCEHGWALRGDDSDPKIKDGAADAFSEAVSWFKAHG